MWRGCRAHGGRGCLGRWVGDNKHICTCRRLILRMRESCWHVPCGPLTLVVVCRLASLVLCILSAAPGIIDGHSHCPPDLTHPVARSCGSAQLHSSSTAQHNTAQVSFHTFCHHCCFVSQVRLGDVIVALNGKAIKSQKDLFAQLDNYKVRLVKHTSSIVYEGCVLFGGASGWPLSDGR